MNYKDINGQKKKSPEKKKNHCFFFPGGPVLYLRGKREGKERREGTCPTLRIPCKQGRRISLNLHFGLKSRFLNMFVRL